MLAVEPAFPRGLGGFRGSSRGSGRGRGRGSFSGRGRNNHVTKPTTSFRQQYGAANFREQKAARLRPKERQQVMKIEKEMDEADVQQTLTAAYLSYSTIRPGMLILGCVKHVSVTHVELALPVRIKAKLPITHISDEYTARLQAMTSAQCNDCPTLKDMYKGGDLIYVKVVAVPAEVNRFVEVSVKPNDLHSDFAPVQLVPGLVLAATFAAKEDHGYFMNVGVRNVRAFLPDQNLGENPSDIGRNVVCSVEQVSHLGSGATIVLKAFNPHSPWVLNVEEASLETVVPGCRLPFTVGEPVEHGLRGMIFEDTVPAYVNELMLTKAASTPKKYSMFKKIPATLMYVMPHTKQVFVSLRPYLNNRVEVDVAHGPGTNIEKACVKYVNSAGVWFTFENKHRALLPRYLLLKQATESGNVDESVVMGNYPIGTMHKVCIMHYDPLVNIYGVTNDPALIDAEIRSVDDIIIGKMYTCRVLSYDTKSISVRVGHARGAVEYELYDRTHKPHVNEQFLVRAVSRLEGLPFIKFTNLPMLVSEKASILQDWDQLDAKRKDQCFHGVVTKIFRSTFLVRFFNNMNGILEKHNAANDAAKISQLRSGTVEKFTVKKFDKATKKIHLVLPYDGEQMQAVVVDATITCMHATGADVRTQDGETGTIPSECFSEFGEHNSLYMRLLQEGKTIPVMKTHSGTYSYRLKEYFMTHPMHIESVKNEELLKGSCITVNGRLFATPLLSNYGARFFVDNPVRNCSTIADGSTIMMRVHNIHKTTGNAYHFKVDTALKYVCENGIDEVYEYVAAYMKDVGDLIQRYQEQHFAFASYTIGQQVECVVESVVPCSEKLAVEVHAIINKSKYVAKGIATAVLSNKPAASYKVGSKVPGRVVWIDVERMLVHVCLDQSMLERIALNGNNGSQTVVPYEPQECCVLFANNYVQVCCLKEDSAQLLIVPVKHHYNEIQPRKHEGNALKVKLIKPIGSMFLAMREKMFLQFDSLLVASKTETTPPTMEFTPQTKVKSPSTIRCRPTPEMFYNDETMNYSDESENDSAEEVQQEGNDTENGTENGDENKEDNDESDDEQITTNDKRLKKGKVSSSPKPLKSGQLKRKFADKAPKHAESNEENGKMLPIKKKKKKANELPVTVAIAKPPKKAKKAVQSLREDVEEQRSTKKSILFVGKKEKETKTKGNKLKKEKMKALIIDQLDGATDFYLHQLDGMEDGPFAPSGKQAGGQKRKHPSDHAQRLPGATNFWDSTPVYKRSAADSSDDESDNSDGESGKAVQKKRTTAKERFEAMKQEEERLRKIEEELANPSVDPHTPDQFDRLVLAQPNNSMLWIRYMAFHMESAELEKARAVGRKALKAIHFREETDRLNVWIALLNLEIRYETVDSFKEVLQEAIQYNDAFKVYTRVIDILIDCQKHTEVQELLELLLKKFRKQNDMWYLVADAWYRIGQGNKVKPLLSQALKSLPTRDHIPLIVKFAFLHNRNENRDEAHLLFEQILTSYPKRTDIWSQYIDMLVKDNLVGNARQILERAIMQRLPLKNMKTLYTKYVNFEEKHGDRDSVRRVKQMAADYVQAQLNNAGVKG